MFPILIVSVLFERLIVHFLDEAIGRAVLLLKLFVN